MKDSSRFFANTNCEYYPCHEGVTELNCLFCYCPLYHLAQCPGTPEYKEKEDRRIKLCTNCTYPHESSHYDEIMSLLKTHASKEQSASS